MLNYGEIPHAAPRGVDSAAVIQVIETRALRGSGSKEDPCREVTQYWGFDGSFLAEYDPHTENGCNMNSKYMGL